MIQLYILKPNRAAGNGFEQMSIAVTTESVHFANSASYEAAKIAISELPARREEPYGWDSTHPWFEYCINAIKPKLIVEVGTWLGASAVYMASLCKRNGLSTKIVCVDTWLGGSEHYDNPKWRKTLDFKFGYPQLYFGFLRNVIESGASDVIVPLPLDTKSGAEVLVGRGLIAQVVYIDAGHSFESCLGDLRNYAPLVSADGMILGDDFRGEEVADAVATFVTQHPEWHLYVRDNKYLLCRRELADLADYRTAAHVMETGADFPAMVTFDRTHANFDKLRNLSLRKLLSLKFRGKWRKFVDMIEHDV